MKFLTMKTFNYVVVLEPLGLLYGSAGAFLSPENLVGRSGTKFPPSAVTFAGLVAAAYDGYPSSLESLRVAGPFWSLTQDPLNFFVPTPFNCLATLQSSLEENDQTCLSNQDKSFPIVTGEVSKILAWQPETSKMYGHWRTNDGESPTGKFAKETWLPISEWDSPKHVCDKPWQFVPHLHPRLKLDERRIVDSENEQGSLFLENAVQMNPETCLIYLSSCEIESGWFRFGGEGHLVNLTSIPLDTSTKELLNRPLGNAFASITPGLWGSNRLSHRYPEQWEGNVEALLTERPKLFRYRLGGEGKHKRLSRGRYAVPPGTVYIMKEEIKKTWHQLEDDLFPKEGLFLNKWGSGLALPLMNTITKKAPIEKAS